MAIVILPIDQKDNSLFKILSVMVFFLPFLCFCGTIPLPSVLEPVADLRRGEARGLGQFSLLSRRRIRVVSVPLFKHTSALLLKTVAGLLSIPNAARQRELSAHSVLSHCAQRTTAQFLRFDVVSFQPELLQFRVVVRRKLGTL